MISFRIPLVAWLGLVLALVGCGQLPAPPKATVQTAEATTPEKDAEAALQAERAKLSPEDRQLVDAQEWCAINNDERLGEMGPPLKVMVKDQPVFLCCGGCKRKALADADKTLAAVAELRARKAAQAQPQ